MKDDPGRKLWFRARRESGIARFERENRSLVDFGGRKCLAYNTPGTSESGTHAALNRLCNDIYRRLVAAEKGE